MPPFVARPFAVRVPRLILIAVFFSVTVPARADAPSLFIESADVNNMGSGHVGITVRNRSSNDVAVAIEARPPGRARGDLGGGPVEASTSARLPVSMPWPKKCSAAATEVEIRLLAPKPPIAGVTADTTPRLLRLTPGACKVTRAVLEDPVVLDHLTASALATRNRGRFYYRNPKIVGTPSGCGDKLVVQAEIVNATSQTIHHAGLRIPQAGVVRDAGVTLAPGESRTVTRAAIWQGFMVPIFLEATHDEAGADALPSGELMKGYNAGVAFLDECAISVSLTRTSP